MRDALAFAFVLEIAATRTPYCSLRRTEMASTDPFKIAPLGYIILGIYYIVLILSPMSSLVNAGRSATDSVLTSPYPETAPLELLPMFLHLL